MATKTKAKKQAMLPEHYPADPDRLMDDLRDKLLGGLEREIRENSTRMRDAERELEKAQEQQRRLAAKLKSISDATLGNEDLARKLAEKPHDEKLRALLAKVKGGWTKLQREGADDARIYMQIRGGLPGYMRTYLNPRQNDDAWIDADPPQAEINGLRFKGRELAAEIRRVMNIPQPAKKPRTKATPQKGTPKVVAPARSKAGVIPDAAAPQDGKIDFCELLGHDSGGLKVGGRARSKSSGKTGVVRDLRLNGARIGSARIAWDGTKKVADADPQDLEPIEEKIEEAGESRSQKQPSKNAGVSVKDTADFDDLAIDPQTMERVTSSAVLHLSVARRRGGRWAYQVACDGFLPKPIDWSGALLMREEAIEEALDKVEEPVAQAARQKNLPRWKKKSALALLERIARLRREIAPAAVPSAAAIEQSPVGPPQVVPPERRVNSGSLPDIDESLTR